MSGSFRELASYNDCQKGVAPEDDSACQPSPISPETGVSNKLSEMTSHVAERRAGQQRLWWEESARHTENLLIDLETGHLDNIGCKGSASLTTAVLDGKRVGNIVICGGSGGVKCLNSLAVLGAGTVGDPEIGGARI